MKGNMLHTVCAKAKISDYLACSKDWNVICNLYLLYIHWEIDHKGHKIYYMFDKFQYVWVFTKIMTIHLYRLISGIWTKNWLSGGFACIGNKEYTVLFPGVVIRLRSIDLNQFVLLKMLIRRISWYAYYLKKPGWWKRNKWYKTRLALLLTYISL